ncbi:type II secretion system protein [Candidatus Nomurabacteria bacterium]|nr:type II secretion system protein [Candidatus Nomurabacteria bacterium]
MKRITNQSGFTIIELLVFITVVLAITIIAASNIRDLRANNRDQESKIDINATAYQLEVFHEKNNYYPEKIEAKIIPGLEEKSIKDRNNLTISEPGSSYTYKPSGCSEGKCKNFELKANLEKEAPFVKQSLAR